MPTIDYSFASYELNKKKPDLDALSFEGVTFFPKREPGPLLIKGKKVLKACVTGWKKVRGYFRENPSEYNARVIQRRNEYPRVHGLY